MEAYSFRRLNHEISLCKDVHKSSYDLLNWGDAPSVGGNTRLETSGEKLNVVLFHVMQFSASCCCEGWLCGGDVMKFIEDFLREVTPSVPLIFAMLRAGQSVVVVLVLGWLWSLIEVDAWRYCRMPETSLLSWVAWTVPYVACTLVFWQDWILEDYLPVKVGE